MSIGLKTLRKFFDEETAQKIRRMVSGEDDPKDYVSVQNWLAQCHNEPSDEELRMEALNEILEGFGVEAIRGNWVDNYYCDVQATYINMGDTYSLTILRDNELGKYILTSWGDWVETNDRKRGLV